MNLSFLIPFIIFVFLALSAFFIYRTPLDLKVVMERAGTHSSLMLSGSWSIFTIISTYTGGERSLSLWVLGKRIFRNELPRKPESRKSPERVSGVYPGHELILQALPLVPDLARFMTAIFHHLTIRMIEGTFIIGLRNPADTGVIFGCFSAIRPLLIPCTRISLSMQPVFDREVLEGRVQADLRISQPLFIPVLMLRLAMKPKARRLIRSISDRAAGVAV